MVPDQRISHWGFSLSAAMRLRASPVPMARHSVLMPVSASNMASMFSIMEVVSGLYKTSLPVSSGAVSAVAQATLRAMMAQRNKANSFFMDDSPFFTCCFVKQLIQSVFIIVVFWKKFNRIFYLYIAKSELPGKKTWALLQEKTPERPAKQGLRRQSKGNAPLSGGGPLRFSGSFALSPPPLPGFPR